MPAVTNVSKQVEDFYILSFTTYHTDATDSRILRVITKSFQKSLWAGLSFKIHLLFPAFVISISTGILKDENNKLQTELECGNYSMSCIVGKSFVKNESDVSPRT
ncbi:hypothetical protein AVEN_109747-1 [Araneus ventricosus]|uniref:Uncharacterized protein n=1 Tax=Araneus ventricosus TaxID=182803 RepID=A0A4Y2TD24_ARAVE|nr:hypothetical protein AVEN_109747-1 [Araneus ventricosus]